MSWLLVKIYLCIALLNSIFAMPQIRSHQIYNPISRKQNTPNIGHNSENSDDLEKSAENEKLIGIKEDAEKRSLTAGDSFTPSDMLPIAEKLFNKVDDPGNGRGFVSSTHSPQELADKLFEAFFSTTKRIIFLKDEDIPGIDALQALALSGEAVDSQVEGVTEAADGMYLRSKLERMKPKRSKYKLVAKIVTEGKQGSTRKANRRSIKLSKYLNKKRHLIINKRRNNRLKQLRNKGARKESETMVSSVFEKGKDKNQSCRWKYNCTNIVDLDTCRIQSECAKNASNKFSDEISIDHNSDEHTLAIDRFRKMLKIFSVDEEVEKILESRNLQSRPSNSNADAVQKVESLAEYFNKIIVDEQLGKYDLASLPSFRIDT